MKRSLTASLTIAAALVLAGCSTPSLHGFDESDRVVVDGLEGVWMADDTVVRIEADADEKLYILAPNGSRHTLAMAVARIEGRHVADVTLNDDDSLGTVDPVLLSFVIPVHKFARLRLEGDTLEHAELDDDWIGKHGGDALGSFAGDENLIAAKGTALRALLAAALDDDDAWDDGQTFIRLKGAED